MAEHAWNHVSDRRLGPCDLPNVHRALTDIQHHWECMATQFGLPQATVETAKLKHHHDPKCCLKYVLDEWLKGNYDTQRFGHPSWRRVCEVTAGPAGGADRALALEIAANKSPDSAKSKEHTDSAKSTEHTDSDKSTEYTDSDKSTEHTDSDKSTEHTDSDNSIHLHVNILFTCTCILLSVVLALYIQSIFLPQTINHLSLPEPLVLYQEYLRDIYRQHEYSIYTKPAEVIAPNRPKQPLNLVMVPKEKNETDRSFMKQYKYAFQGNVDKIRNHKITIEIEEVGLIPGEKPVAHFVLIEGAPGIGKSTLCWQLCRLWAKGKLQHKWDLMVFVEIRDETMRKAQSVYDLLAYPDEPTIRESITREVQKRKGEGLLLIFDGYDELSEDQRSELSVFQQILTNRLLSKATVVVTSRPMATPSLPPRFIQDLDQHIAIVGFDKDGIHTYIRSACGDNRNLSEDFHTYVSSRPFIFSIMYNPLHCTIVTELYIQYWQDGQKGFAPNTLTELYTSLVLNLIRRNSAYNVWHMSDLPAHVNNSLMQLAELAASGIKEEKYIFSNVPHDTLGLMVPVRQIYDIRASQPACMFLHLTLQEYLSALYWCQQTQQQIMDDFLKEGNILRHMDKCASAGLHAFQNTGKDNDECESVHWPHILFLAGLTKLSHPFSLELIPKKDNLRDYYTVSLCQLSFEAHSPQILSTRLSSRKVVQMIRGDDALDAFLLGYCIANSDNTTIWHIKSYRIEIGIFTTTMTCTHFSMISDGLYYSLNTTDWSARPSQPSVHLHIPLKCLLQNIPRIHLLTSVTSELYGIYYEKLHSGEGFSLLQSIFHFFPRLELLRLPELSFILTDSPQLPQSLVSITRLTLPHYNVLLDNLHEYPALEHLDIYNRIYQDWKTNFCPPQKIYENYYQSLQVENDVCLLLERNLPKLAHKLKTFVLHDVHINHLCIHGIAHLLNTSLNHLTLVDCQLSSTDFDNFANAIATSKLKHLKISCWHSSCNVGINPVRGQSLAELLTQSKTLEEVTVEMNSEYTNNCNIVRLLVEAMSHSSVKKLQLKTADYCDVSKVHYDRDRVKVSPSRKETSYHDYI